MEFIVSLNNYKGIVFVVNQKQVRLRKRVSPAHDGD